MHSELEDYEIKARSLIGFRAWYIPDESSYYREQAGSGLLC